MHIVHLASELAPIAKVGGLADVLLGLSREQSRTGSHVDIFIPYYDCLDKKRVKDLKNEGEFTTFFDGKSVKAAAYSGLVENLNVYFIDSSHPDHFYQRGTFYGCQDDPKRFLFFARATIEFLKSRNVTPNVIHVHDWQGAIVPLLLKEVFQKDDIGKAKTVLTIHNLSYQGVISPKSLDEIGIDSEKFLHWNELQDTKNLQMINLLKGGIAYADAITTVSPTYAKEILTPHGGNGLDPLLQYHQKKLKGILNGIDQEAWDPHTDPFLKNYFAPTELQDNLHLSEKKALFKGKLKEILKLGDGSKPIVSCITRLVPQKGIHLIKKALYHTLENGGQFVLLGSSPIPEIQEEFEEIQKEFFDHQDVYLHLEQDEALAHLIYAGSDMLVVPSLFEPCGLTQLIALRYGTIPIVRGTGGLADTIEDIDHSKEPLQKRNGFRFNLADESEIASTIDRAFSYWAQERKIWKDLEKRGMEHDSSWTHSSKEYLNIYTTL